MKDKIEYVCVCVYVYVVFGVGPWNIFIHTLLDFLPTKHPNANIYSVAISPSAKDEEQGTKSEKKRNDDEWMKKKKTNFITRLT